MSFGYSLQDSQCVVADCIDSSQLYFLLLTFNVFASKNLNVYPISISQGAKLIKSLIHVKHFKRKPSQSTKEEKYSNRLKKG